MVISIVLW